mgnify:CR=1 FL=1
MSSSTYLNNLSTFRSTIKRERLRILWEIADRFFDVGRELIRVSINNKTFESFTGNSAASFTIGVYINGTLIGFENGQTYGYSPLMNKIRKGRKVFLKNPKEGRPRAVWGRVDVANETGPETAAKFIASYTPKSNKGVSMVVAVGVEYWIYLASISKVNMLQSAYDSTRSLLDKLVWRKIRK